MKLKKAESFFYVILSRLNLLYKHIFNTADLNSWRQNPRYTKINSNVIYKHNFAIRSLFFPDNQFLKQSSDF